MTEKILVSHRPLEMATEAMHACKTQQTICGHAVGWALERGREGEGEGKARCAPPCTQEGLGTRLHDCGDA